MKYLNFTLLFVMLASTAFASQNKSEVVVRIQAQTGHIDEATLYFDNGINPTYVFQEDAQKVYSGVAGVPAIYSLTSDLVDCSINGFGTSAASQEIAIGYDVDTDGLYDISAPLLDNIDPTSIIRLEDRQLGVFTDLRQGKYNVQLNDADPATGRFFIHISRPVQVTTTASGCSNNDGLIEVSLDNEITWTSCSLMDAFNNQVGTYNNITGQFDFTGLAEGDYYLVFNYNSYSTTQSFHITGRYVITSIVASKQVVEVGEIIEFTASSTNSNNYSWDFGDGTLINGVAHPTINYYQAGEYVVTLICANDYGCSDNAQVNVTVTEATISGINEKRGDNAHVYAAGKEIFVNLNTTANDAQLQVFNLLGQSVYSAPVATQTETVSLDEQPTGYYLVSVKNAGILSTKRVFLSK